MSLRVNAPANMKGKADITINFTLGDNNLKATAKCNLIKIKSAKGISFQITDDKGNNYSKNKKIKKVLRAVFDCGMANWDSLLYVRTGYWVSGLYNNSIVKYVYHEGEQIKYIEFDDGTLIPASDTAALIAYSDAHPDCGYGPTWITTEGYYTTEYVQVPYTEIIHSDGYICRDCGAHFESDSAADAHMLSAEHYSGYVNDSWDDYSIKWDEVIKALSKAVRILK